MFTSIVIFLLGIIDLLRGSAAGFNRQLEKATYAALVLFLIAGVPAFLVWEFAVSFIVLFMIGSSVSWGIPVGAALRQESKESYKEIVAEARRNKEKSTWYIRGWFKETPIRSLIARGFVWGVLPAIPVYIFLGLPLALSMIITFTIAMPLSVIVAIELENTKFGEIVNKLNLLVSRSKKDPNGRDKIWARHELYRGWIVGTLLFAFSMIL